MNKLGICFEFNINPALSYNRLLNNRSPESYLYKKPFNDPLKCCGEFQTPPRPMGRQRNKKKLTLKFDDCNHRLKLVSRPCKQFCSLERCGVCYKMDIQNTSHVVTRFPVAQSTGECLVKNSVLILVSFPLLKGCENAEYKTLY